MSVKISPPREGLKQWHTPDTLGGAIVLTQSSVATEPMAWLSVIAPDGIGHTSRLTVPQLESLRDSIGKYLRECT